MALPTDGLIYNDPRLFRRLGNVTTTATTDILLSIRPYNEPASQAQRSVKSSSANDSNPSGSGAKTVRIVYLDSNYVLKTEDVNLNGTTAVNTVATDIRFIESFFVIKGAACAGAVELFPNTGGTGTAICGIGSGSDQAFLCHHYVPAGYQCLILEWGGVAGDDCAYKLLGQARFDGTNLVDTTLDLESLTSILATSAVRDDFKRTFRNLWVDEKTYIRIRVVPGQATSTLIRGWMELWEDLK